MAKNVHAWTGPTSWGHSGKIDRSGPDKNLSAHGRPTDVKATGMDMQGPTPKSGSGYKALGHPNFEGIGAPNPMSSDRSEKLSSASKPPATKKSKPDVPADPVKWHKKYDMSEGQHMSEKQAMAFEKKNKAK